MQEIDIGKRTLRQSVLVWKESERSIRVSLIECAKRLETGVGV
jgi:hypothetical protein